MLKLAASKTALGLHLILLFQRIALMAIETYSQEFFGNVRLRLGFLGAFVKNFFLRIKQV
jgi:hypothetical protein